MPVPEGLLQLHVAQGPVLTEVHQVFLNYTSAVIRLAVLLSIPTHAGSSLLDAPACVKHDSLYMMHR